MNSVFDYRDYKAFLLDHVNNRSTRGERNRLATAIGCHNGYISQVLNGTAHFSLEQAELINQFLSHSKDQAHYFLLLVQYGRSGSVNLRLHFQEQLAALKEKQFVLKDRLRYKQTLTREDQATFYSSWQYGAVHVLVSIPGCDDEQGLSDYLNLPLERVREIVEFLRSIGLVKRDKGKLVIGTNRIHLESDSPMIAKHHSNWRLRAMQTMDDRRPENLHYSSVITASIEDSAKIREIMVQAIEKIRAVVRSSPNERGYAYSLDFFGLSGR
jgi:uncharacterized protein (TIGR02147 family)